MVNLKTNKIKLKYEKVSLNKIAEETSNIVLEDIKKKKLKFNIKVSDDLPDMVSVDPSRLVQIVVNMISNSLKHTSDGSINLDISLFDIDNFPEFPFTYSDLPDNKYHILFKIKDTGSGIDEDIKRIVDKVLNIKQINKIKSYKNTGFGLLICRDLCSLMGGNIWYKSEEDMGSIFYFTIICDGIKLK
jgi:signal transduction histidine kinase